MSTLRDVSDRPLAELLSLADRTAVVTGAGWGLGKATARRLAEAGASVLLADIDEDAAGTAAHELAGEGRIAIAMRMDVGKVEDIRAAADLAERELGRLDIWVNNAGIVSNTPLFDLPDEEWDRVIEVNQRGVFYGAREAARRMQAHGRGGVIINVASLAGLHGIAPGQVAYVSSKHGVVGLTRQMAIELAPAGIRVLGIAPGVCLTEKTMFLKDADPAALARTGIPGITGTAFGRHGVADDVARTILFCASDLSLFMTGSTLVVDGGTTA